MYKGSSSKNTLTLLVFLLVGIVIGGFIGKYLGSVPFLSWLNYGKEFGLTNPVVLDLEIITLQFGLTLRITMSGIIGLAIAIFIHRKM